MEPYDTIKSELNALAAGIGLTLESTRRGPPAEPALTAGDRKWNAEAAHWRVVLRRGGLEVEVDPFSCGPGIVRVKPKGGLPARRVEFITKFCYQGDPKNGPQLPLFGGVTIYEKELWDEFAEPDPPDLPRVLGHLAGADQTLTETFEQWASSLGWDPDSRRAERAYREEQQYAIRLKQMLGEHYDRVMGLARQL